MDHFGGQAGGSLEPPRTPPAYGSDTDQSGLGQSAAATPAIAIIYCQELNALAPGTSLISPVDGVDLSTSSIAAPAPPVPTPMTY